jgi:uncharacterized protein
MRMRAAAAESLRQLPRQGASGALRFYKSTISPMVTAMFGPACRFEPTCSKYAAEAVSRHGVIRGGAMALYRFIRCNPLGGHGHDPVPMRGHS